MSWMHITIAMGYLMVLLAFLALVRGAMLVYRDLRERREPECDQPETKVERTA